MMHRMSSFSWPALVFVAASVFVFLPDLLTAAGGSAQYFYGFECRRGVFDIPAGDCQLEPDGFCHEVEDGKCSHSNVAPEWTPGPGCQGPSQLACITNVTHTDVQPTYSESCVVDTGACVCQLVPDGMTTITYQDCDTAIPRGR